MKTRNGFVSNSSSSSFVLLCDFDSAYNKRDNDVDSICHFLECTCFEFIDNAFKKVDADDESYTDDFEDRIFEDPEYLNKEFLDLINFKDGGKDAVIELLKKFLQENPRYRILCEYCENDNEDGAIAIMENIQGKFKDTVIICQHPE